jgi:hypothetical protein
MNCPCREKELKMRKLTLLFLASLIAVITNGCVELPSEKILYKDSDIEVIEHEPLVILADGGPSSFELIALGHSYKLSDWIDNHYFCDDCKGFVRTPNGSAIVFIAESQQKSQAGMLTGVVHVIDFKSKSDKEVPLAIKCKGDRFHILVKSYDGNKIVLVMDSNDTAVTDSNYNVYFSIKLGIDLDAKQVTKL